MVVTSSSRGRAGSFSMYCSPNGLAVRTVITALFRMFFDSSAESSHYLLWEVCRSAEGALMVDPGGRSNFTGLYGESPNVNHDCDEEAQTAR